MEIVDKKEFSKLVEDFVTDRPMPYIDAIVMCAERYGLEVEVVGKLINKNIKDKIESEAISLNMIKASAKLPL